MPIQITIREVAAAELPMALLLEADPSRDHIQAYLDTSLALAAFVGAELVGACLLSPVRQGQVELLNMAVWPAWQKKGTGTRLLDAAIATAGRQGADSIVLGTGTFGHQHMFYQRAGFRVVEVQKDYFLRAYEEPLFENGQQHRDRLWMERAL